MTLAHGAVVGSGARPTVLLHGFLGSGRNLASLARRWSQADPARRFLLPDLTGHGASPALPEGATLVTLARDVLATSQKIFGAEPVSLVGHSLGGRVSLAALLDAPGRVADVTLLDIAPGPLPDSDVVAILDQLLRLPDTLPSRADAREQLLGFGLSEGLVDWLLMNLVPLDGGYGWRIDRRALFEAAPRIIGGTDLWPALEMGRPVRCIRGGDSRYVRDEDARRMEALGCPVTTLPGAGHFVHVDAPDALLTALVDESAPIS